MRGLIVERQTLKHCAVCHPGTAMRRVTRIKDAAAKTPVAYYQCESCSQVLIVEE